MESISLKYYDGAVQYSRSITAMWIAGFIPAENLQLFPDILNSYLSGTKERQNSGFQRTFEIVFGPGQMVDADWLFLGNFLTKNQSNIQVQSLTYAYTFNGGTVTESDLGVTLENAEQIAEFQDAFIYGRQFTLRLVEKELRTSWPSGSTADASSTVYIFPDITITGTPGAAQTFITGTAPLNLDKDGNAPPTFTDIDKIIVETISLQEAAVWKTTLESLSSGNITFAAVHSLSGADRDGIGGYKMDVKITLKG